MRWCPPSPEASQRQEQSSAKRRLDSFGCFTKKVLGRWSVKTVMFPFAWPQVAYEAITPDAWHDMTVRLLGARANEDVLVHLRALWGIVRMRSAQPALVQEIARAVPDLERVLGHPPQLLGAWLGPYLKAFAAGGK